MHRQTDYAYQVPAETDFLYAQRFAYEGLGLLTMDLLGTSALVAGLAATPTGPASLNVNIGPGRIYSKQNLDDTAWGLFNAIGGLAADTNADHQIIKQGLFRDTTPFPCSAPGTVGQSINYLIQAIFATADAVSLSLPFVSATPPYPPITPNTLNTVRQDKCVVSIKAGTAATTGTQITPTPDAGNVGLWVITVAQGQTTVTSGNISLYTNAPFISETLTQKISQTAADLRYAPIHLPTRTNITAGGTYSTPAGVRQLRIRMVGAGGGSSGSGSSGQGAGGAGGTSSFNSVVAAGGTGGGTSGGGGSGGTGGSGTAAFRCPGAPGLVGQLSSSSANGGAGGSSLLGGGGKNDNDAQANSGGGAGGQAISSVSNGLSGSGGGSGEYVELIINNPSATYTCTIGTGGTAGSAGASGSVGHVGGSGMILVDEIY